MASRLVEDVTNLKQKGNPLKVEAASHCILIGQFATGDSFPAKETTSACEFNLVKRQLSTQFRPIHTTSHHHHTTIALFHCASLFLR
jgi:hypothetical protein